MAFLNFGVLSIFTKYDQLMSKIETLLKTSIFTCIVQILMEENAESVAKFVLKASYQKYDRYSYIFVRNVKNISDGDNF